MRTNAQKVIKAAHLVDGDLLTSLLLPILRLPLIRHGLGLQQTEIGMISLGKPVAGETLAAGHTIGSGRFTEQGGSKLAGEIEFAQAFLPGKQERMRQTFATLLQAVPDLCVKFNNVHKPILEAIFSSTLRISSRG